VIFTASQNSPLVLELSIQQKSAGPLSESPQTNTSPETTYV